METLAHDLIHCLCSGRAGRLWKNFLWKNFYRINLSRSTRQRKRSVTRLAIADDIKQTFTSDATLTVHWDGKLLHDIESRETVDRLAVPVSEGENKASREAKNCVPEQVQK